MTDMEWLGSDDIGKTHISPNAKTKFQGQDLRLELCMNI